MNKRTFNEEEKALIHRTMMNGASKDDLALFISTCERTGLDPFARQIMPSSRNVRQKDGTYKTIWTWLVTIDGLRKIAVDSGDYEGQEGPWWCGEDGEWKEIWTGKKPCFAAKVLVHRKGFRVGLSGIAKYDSYVQKKNDGTPNQVWSTLGDHMTAKCAEALALRRAYPNEMAGLYTEDEGEAIGPVVVHDSSTTPASEEETTPGVVNGWTIESQERFADLQDRIYSAFKQAGKLDKHPNEAEKWRKRMAADTAEKVLPAMQAFTEKLEAAAKAQDKAA